MCSQEEPEEEARRPGVGCYEGGEARGRVGGTSGSGDVEVGEWKVAMGGTGGGGGGRGEEGVVAMAGERPAFLREIFLRRVAESGR